MSRGLRRAAVPSSTGVEGCVGCETRPASEGSGPRTRARHNRRTVVPGQLEGKVVAVTGGGRGIGRGVSMLAAREGAKVVVCDAGVAVDGSGADAGPAQDVVRE